MHKIPDNVAKVQARIQKAVEISGQKPEPSISGIQLIAASKTRSPEEIKAAYECGIQDFGENYCQEALDKITTLNDLAITWHFIGPIQSNKTKLIAENFQWVHTVDRTKTARRLSEQRPAGLPPLQVCLQINISKEAAKSGFSLERLEEEIEGIAQLPNLRLRGLMAIPEKSSEFNQQRKAFAELAQVLRELNLKDFISPKLDTLSMGMSADMEAAIAEGATHVRIGTDIFGPRKSKTT